MNHVSEPFQILRHKLGLILTLPALNLLQEASKRRRHNDVITSHKMHFLLYTLRPVKINVIKQIQIPIILFLQHDEIHLDLLPQLGPYRQGVLLMDAQVHVTVLREVHLVVVVGENHVVGGVLGVLHPDELTWESDLVPLVDLGAADAVEVGVEVFEGDPEGVVVLGIAHFSHVWVGLPFGGVEAPWPFGSVDDTGGVSNFDEFV